MIVPRDVALSQRRGAWLWGAEACPSRKSRVERRCAGRPVLRSRRLGRREEKPQLPRPTWSGTVPARPLPLSLFCFSETQVLSKRKTSESLQQSRLARKSDSCYPRACTFPTKCLLVIFTWGWSSHLWLLPVGFLASSGRGQECCPTESSPSRCHSAEGGPCIHYLEKC